MKYIVALIAVALACSSCQGIDAGHLADALTAALEEPLAKIEGLSGPDRVAILDAVREGIQKRVTDLQDGSFNWEGPLWGAIGMVGSYFGVNIRRDMFRRKRGEPVGSAPAKP